MADLDRYYDSKKRLEEYFSQKGINSNNVLEIFNARQLTNNEDWGLRKLQVIWHNELSQENPIEQFGLRWFQDLLKVTRILTSRRDRQK